MDLVALQIDGEYGGWRFSPRKAGVILCRAPAQRVRIVISPAPVNLIKPPLPIRDTQVPCTLLQGVCSLPTQAPKFATHHINLK